MNVWGKTTRKEDLCVWIIVHKITLKNTIKHINIPLSNITLILNVNSKKTLVQCLKASKVLKAICIFFFFILQHKAERKKYQNFSLQSIYNVAFVQSMSSLPVAEAGCKASCLNKPDYRILQSVSPLTEKKKKAKNKLTNSPHISDNGFIHYKKLPWAESSFFSPPAGTDFRKCNQFVLFWEPFWGFFFVQFRACTGLCWSLWHGDLAVWENCYRELST